jgi:hypothetical protein
VGGEGVERKGAEDPRARTRARREARRLSHRDEESWEFEGRTKLSTADLAKQLKQNRTGYTTHPASAHWFVNDLENPYSEEKRFDWMRGITSAAARCCGDGSRIAERSRFRGEREGGRRGRLADSLRRHRALVRLRRAVCRHQRQKENLPQLPDGQFLPPMEMNCLEQQVQERIADSLAAA